MNVIRFLRLCAVVGTLVILLGTMEVPQVGHEAIAAATVSGTALGLPFGGKVLSTIPCNSGFLLLMYPTGPTFYPFLMWTYATFGYRYNLKAPPVASQWITGRAQGYAPCVIGKVVVGGGPVITFYGSSLPGVSIPGLSI